MSGSLFRCLKCGSCCRDIFDDREGHKRGLTLTAEEASLFPGNLIAPLMALGMEKPEIIILYQLNVNDCPFIDQTNNCRMYEKRPLICRAFPLSQGGYSTKCKLFSFPKNFPENFVKIAINWGVSQLEAETQLDQHIISHFKKEFKKRIGTWSFDLGSNQWALRKRYDECDEPVSF